MRQALCDNLTCGSNNTTLHGERRGELVWDSDVNRQRIPGSTRNNQLTVCALAVSFFAFLFKIVSKKGFAKVEDIERNMARGNSMVAAQGRPQ